ncbi:methyl-accepting chemotaxis protein [Propionivibrio limicola]|uniref:methyl-accepting chemotaxis protein n=1 Tax=Propionivibrio limicola TaxID=167645 RepID=UPI001290B626|nr:methyl-accepting chemotaxis protein [Propionivibrio limicola]
MKNITIAHRILLMIGASIVSLLVVGASGLYVANKESENITRIKEDSIASITTLTDVRQSFMALQAAVYVHSMISDETVLINIEGTIKGHTDALTKQLQAYEKLLSNDEDRKLFEGDQRNFNAYLEFLRNDALPKSRSGDKQEASNVIITQGAAIAHEALKAIDDHVEFNKQLADTFVAAAQQSARTGKIVSISVIVGGIAVISILGLLMLRNIRSSLNQIQSMVDRVERDLDFTVRVNVTKQDEIGQTTRALNRLLDKLQDNLRSIAGSAKSVATAAGQMATTSTQVATASHQQSEAASGMAATVEEMTVSINHVAERAHEADRLSNESGRLATTGEQIIGQTAQDIQNISTTVHEAASLIQGLEQHSQEISNVVAVIKEVADQTNLLALNAAIEAARAGEQGRGFAVVADEVRKLAERTTASTQQIAETINTMRTGAENAVTSMQGVVELVSAGVERALEANESIKLIGEGSRNAVAMVGEITAAIREQGAATNNISSQVEHIAQMSEESSAAAANSAETANDLDRLAGDMQRIVSSYRL